MVIWWAEGVKLASKRGEGSLAYGAATDEERGCEDQGCAGLLPWPVVMNTSQPSPFFGQVYFIQSTQLTKLHLQFSNMSIQCINILMCGSQLSLVDPSPSLTHYCQLQSTAIRETMDQTHFTRIRGDSFEIH